MSIVEGWQCLDCCCCLTLQEPMVGMFAFASAKQAHAEGTPHGGRCIAHMYIMFVEEELEVWPESAERQRHWVGGHRLVHVGGDKQPILVTLGDMVCVSVNAVCQVRT